VAGHIDCCRHQATLDIQGVYRMLLKLTSPKLVAVRLPKMMSKYFDFGTTRRDLTPQSIVVRQQILENGQHGSTLDDATKDAIVEDHGS
jgi:hypothetical protein